MSDTKYTLGESAAIFALLIPVIALMAIVMFPLVFLVAWMRETVWNWYCPMFHLPPVSLWSMVIVGLFVGSFMPNSPTMKDDLLKFKSWQNLILMIVGQMIGFLIIALIHVWYRG